MSSFEVMLQNTPNLSKQLILEVASVGRKNLAIETAMCKVDFGKPALPNLRAIKIQPIRNHHISSLMQKIIIIFLI